MYYDSVNEIWAKKKKEDQLAYFTANLAAT
jgi:hypothetical protein